MSQALYRKWRPRLWEQVIGQEHVVRTLQNAIRGGRIGHAYLFSGPRGTGKTTTARLLAKAVNCKAPDPAQRPCDKCEFCLAVNEGRFLDLIEIDAASNTSVDDVRELRDKINFSPTQADFKIYIIDEVHMLSTAAFNALLKTLEEPPAHAIFILATTEAHKIPPTVLSRCQRHEFRRIPLQAIAGHLRDLANKEGVKIDDDALTLIARQATGALRDGISLLDQLASSGENITLAMAQEVLGASTNQLVIDLVSAILSRQPKAGLDAIHQAVDSGADARQFARQIVEYLRGLLLIQTGNMDQVDATQEVRHQMSQHARAFDRRWLLEALGLFNKAASEVRGGWQPGLLLELAFAEAVEPPLPVSQAANAQPLEIPPGAMVRPARELVAVEPRRPASPAPHVPEPQEATAQPGKPAKKVVQVEQPVAQPEPPEPAGEAATDADELKISDIRNNWAKIRGIVRQQRSQTEALLNSCKHMVIRKGVLVLGFAGPVLKDKMENSDNRQLVEQAIGQVLGRPVSIHSVVVETGTNKIPDDLDVDADGMVGAALDLGAEIVKDD